MNSSNMSDCQTACSRCSSDIPTPEVGGEDVFIGWRLGIAALWAFVLPLAIALTAAVVVRSYWPGPTRMLLAVVAGLTVGGAISWAATKLIRTTHTEIQTGSDEI